LAYALRAVCQFLSRDIESEGKGRRRFCSKGIETKTRGFCREAVVIERLGYDRHLTDDCDCRRWLNEITVSMSTNRVALYPLDD